jgi:hypothetical protein
MIGYLDATAASARLARDTYGCDGVQDAYFEGMRCDRGHASNAIKQP